MAIYNVLVPVVALVEADSPDAAIDRLRSALSAHDFEPYDGEETDAFKAADQNVPENLPPPIGRTEIR